MESCDVTFCPSELRIVLSRSVMWIRIRLDPHHFGLPDPGSKKISQNHEKLEVDRQFRSRQIDNPPFPFLRNSWPHVTSLLCRNLRLSIQSIINECLLVQVCLSPTWPAVPPPSSGSSGLSPISTQGRRQKKMAHYRVARKK